MIFFDTETCGFHGQPVLLQYAIDDGPVELYNLWLSKIKDTLKLIEFIAEHKGGVCGFNIGFDWFMLCKFYTMLNAYPDKEAIPYDIIKELACYEKDARDGPCLRPVAACDLMLHARKGKYQSTMDRHDIRIKRVPTALAHELSRELNERIKLNPLYFERRKEQLNNPWQVFDIIDTDTGEINRALKDIVLKFSPSTALKALAKDILGADVVKFGEIHCDLYPEELAYAPFAEAIEPHQHWRKTWPAVIDVHIRHWRDNEKAQSYATDDVVYLQKLYPFFGSPVPGDVDSDLACAVAAIRWRGYRVNIEKIKELRTKAVKLAETIHVAPSQVKKMIWPLLDTAERMGTGGSTKMTVLVEMTRWMKDCPECEGSPPEGGCSKCKGVREIVHPAAIIAKKVILSRKARKEIELYDKLITAGRLHADFKVIGAMSGRMAGASKMNAQGIKSTTEVRSCFPMAWEGMRFPGGDFESFEVVIAAAVYNDKRLYADLTRLNVCSECAGVGEVKEVVAGEKTGNMVICPECKGSKQSKQKIHGLFGAVMFDTTYELVVASKGTEFDMYKKGKSGVFLKMYGGQKKTFIDRLGITDADAERAEVEWGRKYPDIAKSQQRIVNMFCSMKQPDGIGKKVYWQEPSDFMPSLLGFKRYFTLENRICKVLFDLAEKPPTAWTNLRVTVRRRDRDQSAAGAVRSALFGAAFQIQAANLRAATNHEIQSTGAGITKEVQHDIWSLQPAGAHEWHVMPMNVHDEILVPCKPELEPEIERRVKAKVDTYKPIVPLISIDWKSGMETWADK